MRTTLGDECGRYLAVCDRRSRSCIAVVDSCARIPLAFRYDYTLYLLSFVCDNVGMQMGIGHSWPNLCTCSGGTCWGNMYRGLARNVHFPFAFILCIHNLNCFELISIDSSNKDELDHMGHIECPQPIGAIQMPSLYRVTSSARPSTNNPLP